MVIGLQLDILTRIVNVSWASGLAVIFGAGDQDAPPFIKPTVTETETTKKKEDA